MPGRGWSYGFHRAKLAMKLALKIGLISRLITFNAAGCKCFNAGGFSKVLIKPEGRVAMPVHGFVPPESPDLFLYL